MTSAYAHAELYAEVQQFYARQMQLLDARKLEAYADTFTDDAEFAHTPGRAPARTRAGILRDLHEVHQRFEGDRIRTTAGFVDTVLADPRFAAAEHSTHLVDDLLGRP